MLKACVYFRSGPWGTPQWRKLVPICVGDPVLSTFSLQSTNWGEEVFFTFSRHLERLSQWAFQAFKDSTSKFSFTLVSLCIGNNYKYCKLSRISNNVCGYCSSLSKTGDEFYSFVSRLTSEVTPWWDNRIKFISYRKSNIADKTCCGKALLRCVSRYRFYSRPEFYFLKCPRHRSWQQM